MLLELLFAKSYMHSQMNIQKMRAEKELEELEDRIDELKKEKEELDK